MPKLKYRNSVIKGKCDNFVNFKYVHLVRPWVKLKNNKNNRLSDDLILANK
jgi:hypothetical protein